LILLSEDTTLWVNDIFPKSEIRVNFELPKML
jgi:hypothetical protein